MLSSRPRHRTWPRTWIAALVAIFMVLVLPACWYGALARAQALGQAAPSSSNNNEEREEHEEREIATRDAQAQPPPPPIHRNTARPSRVPVAIATPTVAPAAPFVSAFAVSVRRLL